MKKIILACFFAILMLLVPFNTAAQTANVSDEKNISSATIEVPEIRISKSNYNQINNYINNNFEGADKEIAENIRDTIINKDTLTVNVVELFNKLIEYGYQIIPQDQLDLVKTKEQLEELINYFWVLDLFGGLVFLITSFVASRLGWMYTLINEGYNVFSEGVQLAIRVAIGSIDLALDLVDFLNLMLTVPEKVTVIMEKLYNQLFNEFLNLVLELTGETASSFLAMADDLIVLFLLIPDALDYLKYEIKPFFQWLLGGHWEDNLKVSGLVLVNLLPISGAQVTCRGQTTTTGGDGTFSYNVAPEPDEESFPPNVYYGLHNCQVTVEKDGKVLKETSKILSYSFSGGWFNWPFIIFTGRAKAASFGLVLMQKFQFFLQRIFMLFPNFFKQINRVDILLT